MTVRSRASQPVTQYAKSGDLHIAYQVIGDGPIDLVIVPGWVSHIEIVWQEPKAAAFLRRLAEFSRLILFDKRGTGMSDPVSYAPPVDERMDDIGAVMDAAGSQRAALLGYSEGGALALVFAASHPQRISGVIAYASFARILRSPDYRMGFPEGAISEWLATFGRAREHGDFYDVVVPSRRGDEEFREWFGRITRQSASPRMMELFWRANLMIDIRSLLSSIRVPVLVAHRAEDQLVRVEHGRYLAEHIPGAKYVELDGGDHWPWFGDTETVVQEVEEFLTGTRHAPPADRVLATVMFTDLVDSTAHLAHLGDHAWKQLLDQHDSITERQIERFRGRLVKHTGDGILATFDGPARAVECARAIQEANHAIGLQMRVGLHVGECELRGDDIGGLAVHTAARVADAAAPGEILVSSTLRDLVAGSGLEFTERGCHQLKGIPGEWTLFAVSSS